MKPIAENRKARFDFFIGEKFEAGIKLQGCEVKSIREGKVNLKDAYVRLVGGEAFLINCHISPYSHLQGHMTYDPTASRKLLLKRIEINRLQGITSQKGHAIIALTMYFKKGLVKVEIATAKGKKQFDKRDSIKQRIHDRESKAAVKKFTRRG